MHHILIRYVFLLEKIIHYVPYPCVHGTSSIRLRDILNFFATKNDFNDKKKKTVISQFNDDNSEVIKKMSKSIEKGLIMFDDTVSLKEAASSLTFEINQEVYFFDKSSLELYESYDINNVKIVQKLGHLEKSLSHSCWDEGMQQRLVKNVILKSC